MLLSIIDRESFNFAHPHYQYIATWVHNALRQLTNKHKVLARGNREQRTIAILQRTTSAFDELVAAKLREAAEGPDWEAPKVVFNNAADDVLKQLRASGTLAFPRYILEAAFPRVGRTTLQQQARIAHEEARLVAVTKMLDAYRLLGELSDEKQQQLIAALAAIISFEFA
ncbi:MAG: hypothetical protein H0U54_09330 [Acidobacteria bacterium]|nr:hypothetical protein [Acidobacteriota bacterium]